MREWNFSEHTLGSNVSDRVKGSTKLVLIEMLREKGCVWLCFAPSKEEVNVPRSKEIG